MKELFLLFFTFAKIGTFTFGGGYAMLSMLQKEVVQKNKWVTEEELLDYYAIGQCTPGIIAVNTATFIGKKEKGILGGIVATLGMVFPSLVIITIIAAFIKNFLQYEIVQHIFNGIQVCVAVQILNSVISMGKKAIVDKICLAIAIVSFLCSLLFTFSPIYIVLAAAILGLLLRKGEVKHD